MIQKVVHGRILLQQIYKIKIQINIHSAIIVIWRSEKEKKRIKKQKDIRKEREKRKEGKREERNRRLEIIIE